MRASLKECVFSRRCSVSSRTRKKYTKHCDIIADCSAQALPINPPPPTLFLILVTVVGRRVFVAPSSWPPKSGWSRQYEEKAALQSMDNYLRWWRTIVHCPGFLVSPCLHIGTVFIRLTAQGAYLIFGPDSGRLFEPGRLLTFSAFRMGAYSR